jgi:hypothetical protein
MAVKFAVVYYTILCCGPGTQRESPKVKAMRVISSRRREAQFGNPHKHTNTFAQPLLPTAMVFVSHGFVLVQVQVGVVESEVVKMKMKIETKLAVLAN